jgi:CO dehydrogenase/acetyl-CoA synthase beta subunit
MRTKIDIWTIIASVLVIVLGISFGVNLLSNRTLKKEQQTLIQSEIKMKEAIENNTRKIDSLRTEINKRDSLILSTNIKNHTLEQFQKQYEKNYIRINNLSLDSAILLLSKEIGDWE